MRALRVAVLKQVDMDIQIVLIADFVFPIVRVGTVGRHKRRNHTHEILMPSEQSLSNGIVFTNLHVSRSASVQLPHTA